MKTEKSVIRWGILGCGNVAEVKSGPAFQKTPHSQLVAVMRRQGDLAQQFAQRHGVPRWYDNAEALIHDPEVDAVYIATPVDNHANLALQVAKANKPAYVEKPMARHFPECQAMLEAFTHARLPLFVAYYRRKLPRFLTVAALLEQGALGTITAIRYHYGSASHRKPLSPLPWRLDAARAGAGLFLDLGCHVLDILDFLLGPVHHIQGSAYNVASTYDVEDVVLMTFQVGKAIPGVASWNFAQQQHEDCLDIEGTDGHLRLSVFGDSPIRLTRGKEHRDLRIANPPHIQQPLIESIVDDLLGRGTCPSTGTTAARTSLVMDTVLDGYYGGRQDRFWERPESWPGRRTW
ncbi:MAG TPA: Gfo/Idh/MocA family oxidoreductase [Polyangiaceae bacterium]|jgi:predicted dehydrogenase|nr:MAG: Glucose--fructose oxidoreductase precursor [Deltaproteobacteria bacterium ADurb.Bin207]HNS96492.1 Gfo/Idh/MocA family oxidoreductase [Polyangiaceae bacterium]HNZ24067.1 Gfo/Idh/MocA family oxidoreductase [Polyangiaceae bacterium]HOD21858.1 Gfo/Idh/MocA family oxidoreductase [Polyangiaceae bacterium]HOE50972.1 Gfo/Idh/MocA family oxidoreductase [Polyangiaceae bacterium]